jgi:hypothetical protein
LSHGAAAWEVRVTGTGSTLSSLTDHEDGTATVRYTCTCSGRHRVSIRLGDHHLVGSPFGIDVTVGDPAPCFATAAAAAQLSLRGALARWAELTAHARPQHNARVRMASNAPAMAELKVHVHLHQIGVRHCTSRRMRHGVRVLCQAAAASRDRRASTLCAVRHMDMLRARRGLGRLQSSAAARRERVGVASAAYRRAAYRFLASSRGSWGLKAWRHAAVRRSSLRQTQRQLAGRVVELQRQRQRRRTVASVVSWRRICRRR